MAKPSYIRKDLTGIILWSPVVTDPDCTDPENFWLSITSVGGKCTWDFKTSTFEKYHKYIKETYHIWKHEFLLPGILLAGLF